MGVRRVMGVMVVLTGMIKLRGGRRAGGGCARARVQTDGAHRTGRTRSAAVVVAVQAETAVRCWHGRAAVRAVGADLRRGAAVALGRGGEGCFFFSYCT